eukprot:CAMPEP_0197520220 /NCGR_PEP_ID=MMETSP1318-20131121/5536_1 /TAXON_ID=552666 /ORGANISM="Partenskyella glossopodia, Strain RCC365" /LENGTH=158 /DNA_ID=CAMNT_0043071657 /DNA_START=251 /DNA_END=727 /DNA_ORIENTATION=+
MTSRLHNAAAYRSRRSRSTLARCFVVFGGMRVGYNRANSVDVRIEFLPEGKKENTVPEISLTRSIDGKSGVAKFRFEKPSLLEDPSKAAEVTGMTMLDDEGKLETIDVQTTFVGEKPVDIEAKYIIKSADEWDRFMRFMERYSKANGLSFQSPADHDF